MATIEERLRRIEQALNLGAAGDSGLREEISRLKITVANLRTERGVGNVLGGPVRTEIAPGALPIGPYRQDLDSSFHLTFTLWIPDYLLRIKSATLRLKPLPIRSSVTVSTSSATTPSGGGSTTPAGGGGTSSSDGAHIHTGSLGGSTEQQVVTTTANDGAGHTHGVVVQPPLGASGSVGINTSGAHSHSTPSHTHNTPDHTHPGHTHNLTLAIAESGMASSLRLYIDGVDRTTALGGPWNAAVELDIRQYLVNARQVPVVGAHEIQVRSSTAGAVEVTGDIYGVIKAIQ
ncbi:MAG TPA: hypothetical protein VNI83_02090 [Vicinamibacterales bacterium]|nr:hypothetical protein [Vicinamibacterales bacterium]